MANEALEKLAKLGTIDELAKAASTEIAAVKAAVPTAVSQLANDSEYQTKEQVSKAIKDETSKMYQIKGSKTFETLPEPAEDKVGWVYNVSNKFTTDTRFVEGAGKKFPAGTNVVIVQDESEEYKFDVYAGEIDLSDYIQKQEGKDLSDNNYSDDDKEKLDGVAEGATKVTASETAGHININDVDTAVIDVATDEEAKAVIDKYFPKGE